MRAIGLIQSLILALLDILLHLNHRHELINLPLISHELIYHRLGLFLYGPDIDTPYFLNVLFAVGYLEEHSLALLFGLVDLEVVKLLLAGQRLDHFVLRVYLALIVILQILS